jgi:hypothetical protein
MGTPLHSLQILGLLAANIVIGFVLVKWLMGLVAKLTEDEPYLGCVGLPVTMLVAMGSLLIWIVATP